MTTQPKPDEALEQIADFLGACWSLTGTPPESVPPYTQMAAKVRAADRVVRAARVVVKELGSVCSEVDGLGDALKDFDREAGRRKGKS